MIESTKKLIEEFSPMWTSKQAWEFEQSNRGLTFDLAYAEPGEFASESWRGKMSYPDSEVRETVARTFENMDGGMELWIANKGAGRLEDRHVAYVMAVLADVMIDEEICLNFRTEDGCLVASIDTGADLIDCREFFEEFYHLATGFNYGVDAGIPEDQTEAEIYLTRLQEEFDERMAKKLGGKYLPGNADPDTISEE